MYSLFDQVMSGFGPFEPTPTLAVGVSGGADSLCLVLLAHHWVRQRSGQVVALMVDHGVRPETKEEIQQTQKTLEGHHIKSHILVLGGLANHQNFQHHARTLRYEAMFRWCYENGALHLLTAHHQDDQFENFFIRLERGSGMNGLKGMGAVQCYGWGRLLRPLLGFKKMDLVQFLQSQNTGWVNDPSNQNIDFNRVQWRKSLQHLNKNHVHLESRVLKTMNSIRTQASWDTDDMVYRWSQMIQIMPQGWLTIDHASWVQLSPWQQDETLKRCLQVIGGELYPPRQGSIERLKAKMQILKPQEVTTLARCLIWHRQHPKHIHPKHAYPKSGIESNTQQWVIAPEFAPKDACPISHQSIHWVIYWADRFRIVIKHASHHDPVAAARPMFIVPWHVVQSLRLNPSKHQDKWSGYDLPYAIRKNLPCLVTGENEKKLDKLVSLSHFNDELQIMGTQPQGSRNEILGISDTIRIHVEFSPRIPLTGQNALGWSTK